MILNLILNTKHEQKIYNTSFFAEDYTSAFMQGLNLNNVPSQLKLSAVYRCIDVRSNSIGKFPIFTVDTTTHKRIDTEIKYLLSVKPNKYMTPFSFLKAMQMNVDIKGNGYAQIVVNKSGKMTELNLLDPDKVVPTLEKNELYYVYTDSNGKATRLDSDEVIHFKGISFDGIKGVSILEYARTVTSTAISQEEFQRNFYARGGRPQSTLNTVADLSGLADKISNKSKKELMREEWERANTGLQNANRVAILDNGLKYEAVPQISQKDMAFIESKDISIADIARFFGVPLYKLYTGKESYSSNEQNSIAYVSDTLQPLITQYEQELTFKGLSDSEISKGISLKFNLTAELRGDSITRATYYEKMLTTGPYCVNDVLDLEDMERVPGGDVHFASLNYIPLEKFEELSIARNMSAEAKTVKEEDVQK